MVDFIGREVTFQPNRGEIRDSIKNAITEGVNSVCKYELFQNQPEVEIYMSAQEQEEHLFEEQNDLMSLALGSESLLGDTEKIG